MCGEDGHMSRDCSKRRQQAMEKKEVLSCFYCGGQGHYKRDCPLLKPRQETSPKQQQEQLKEQQDKDIVEETQTITTIEKNGDPKENKTELQKEERKSLHSSGRQSGGRGNESRPVNQAAAIGRYRPSPSRGRGGGEQRGRGRGRGEHFERKEYVSPSPIYDHFRSLPPFFDTHCHLEYLMERLRIRKYRELSRRYSYPPNYDGCITSFCDPAGLSFLSQSDQLLSEPKVWGSFGFHPHHAAHLTDTVEDKIISKLKEPKCVAFGELGLDYSEHSLEQSNKDIQQKAVRRLLTMCPVFEKPLVLHCRDAEEDLYEIMKEVLPPNWKIHLHCFTGSLQTAQKFTTAFPNLYIGITGHISYNKFRQTRDVVRTLPLNRILLETDTPYMVPAGVEERWSHPPMVAYVAEDVAKARGVTLEEVLVTTRKNTKDIYGV